MLAIHVPVVERTGSWGESSGGAVLSHGSLASIAEAIRLNHLDHLVFQSMGGGYRRAVVNAVDDVVLAWLRWPPGSVMPLRGYGAAEGRCHLVSGALLEYRFVPQPLGFEFERVLLEPGMTSVLPRGSFHFIEAVGEALSVHAGAASRESDVVPVAGDVLAQLRDAFHRDVDRHSGPFPSGLLAMLRGALSSGTGPKSGRTTSPYGSSIR